jgi:ATP-dependent Clp protease ATP-binding subunit ClpC
VAGHLSAKSRLVSDASQNDHSTLTLERFTPEARAWIVAAQALSDERQHAEVVPLHVLSAGLTTEPKLADALKRAGADTAELARAVERLLSRLPRGKEPAYLADPTLSLLERAEREAEREARREVLVTDLVNALSHEVRGPVGELFRVYRIEPGGLRAHLGPAAPAPAKSLPAFRELEPGAAVVERPAELSRLLTLLERHTKQHPLLVGEPGVGRYALIRAFAARVARGEVPKGLQGLRLVELDLGALAAGTRLRGEVEERLRRALVTLGEPGEKRLLVVRELDQLVFDGVVANAAGDLLRGALERGEVRLLATTSPEGLKKLAEREPFLVRSFSVLQVDEPNAEEAARILAGVSARLTAHHAIAVGEAAVRAAVDFARRYVQDRFLPESAIDLLDEALAQKRVSGETAELVEADVARTVAVSTGIPVQRLLEGEADRLLHFEERLRERVIGQEPAVIAIARAVRRGRVGLRDPRRPIGSFLFLGPSGVGKTELAKVMAELLFDDERALTRLDMSEFMERHMAQRLIGAPPGYADSEQGGFLTEAVRRRPYSALLFDEVEKAHHDVFNLMLQVLDEGRLTDGRGRLADFSNTVVILTSNIGSSRVLEADPRELETDAGREALRETLLGELGRFFRPELLNRIDEIVVFQPLSRQSLTRIVDLRLNEVERLLGARRLKLEVSPAAKTRLVELDYDPALGARPLRRTVLRHVQDPVAEALLRGQVADGSTLSVDVDPTDGEGFVLSTRAP